MTLRGVKVGTVNDIAMIFDAQTDTVKIAVYVQMEKGLARTAGGDPEELRRLSKASDEEIYEFLIEKGLKAQLDMQSIVTGQLQVAIDFYPDKPLNLTHLDPRYPEIPTIPTTLEQLGKSLQNLNVEEISEKFTSALDGIERVANSTMLEETIGSIHEAALEARSAMEAMNTHLVPLLADSRTLVRDVNKELSGAVADLDETLRSVRGLVEGLSEQVGPLGQGMEASLGALTSAAREAEKTIKEVGGLVGEDSPTTAELNRALKELSAAARAIRVWADYLERHPEALIQGKGAYGR